MRRVYTLLFFAQLWAATFAFTAVHKPTSVVTSSTSLYATSSDKGVAIIAGATGYIGKSTVREAVRQGYTTYALVRDTKKVEKEAKAYEQFFNGANVVQVDVTDEAALNQCMQEIASKHTTTGNKSPIDVLVSCLASRSGIKKDAYLIDYQATLNFLRAGQQRLVPSDISSSSSNNSNDQPFLAKHFVLLSAFCCKNPWLQFQQAKLKFEAQLQEQTDLTWSIIRPTAFFKSVSGQLEVVQSGAPYVMFGDGKVTRCNPIAENELAEYLLDSSKDPSRQGRIINLGGPDDPLTMQMQGAMLFNATGMEPKYAYAPLWIFDAIINSFQFLADISKLEKLENAAETARIGKYYAVEDMLTTSDDEKYGTVKLQDHYNRIASEGQEYDPYTTMFARARMGKFGENNKIEVDATNGSKVKVEEKETSNSSVQS